MKKLKREKYQTVFLTFSDGTKANYTGKAVLRPGKHEGLKVTDIAFTEPKELPLDCKFDIM